MDREHVGAGEQVFFGHCGDTVFSGPLRRQVLAPGNGFHAERLTDPGRARAKPAEAQQAQRLASQSYPDTVLPATTTHRPVLGRQIPGSGEDQRPGVFDGRTAGAPGRGTHDAQLPRRSHVDGGVARPGAHEQFELRQPRQHLGREPGALTHRDNHLESRQQPHHLVGIGEGPGEHLDLRAERIPIGEAECHVLVVVQDRDLHATQANPGSRSSCHPG
jgi:hypothetical protein